MGASTRRVHGIKRRYAVPSGKGAHAFFSLWRDVQRCKTVPVGQHRLNRQHNERYGKVSTVLAVDLTGRSALLCAFD